MKALRIFISSPGDVGAEREKAREIFERLNLEFSGHLVVQPYFWEHEPMKANTDFQGQIEPPSQFDIFVCLLWSRLGSRLHPALHEKEDGSTYASGTEYEIIDALKGYKKNHYPEIYFYRRQSPPLIPTEPVSAARLALDEQEQLNTFWESLCKDHGHFVMGFNLYKDLSTFETKFESDMRKILQAKLPEGVSSEQQQVRSWDQGSPFRGLETFDFEHAAIFFGRTKAIDDVIQAMKQQAAKKRAFVLIFGASGSGKSSLARAGVLPLLIKPGVIEGVGIWRRAMLKPGNIGNGDMFELLARTLMQPEALPELGSDGTTQEQLAEMLRLHPEGIGMLLKGTLSQIGREMQWREKLEKQPRALMVLLLDQMEELFTVEKIAPQREAFLRAISALSHSGYVWILATLRSDFFARCAESETLLALTRDEGQYHLGLPSEAQIGQMIRLPAAAAGLYFEQNRETGIRLDDLLRDEAMKHPGTLPLLQFALEELYKNRDQEKNLLRLETYRTMKGVTGAVAQKAEATFGQLSAQGQAALDAVLRQLILIGQGDEEVAARRVVLEKDVIHLPGNAEFVEKFLLARLLISDRDSNGQAILAVAHEALFKVWPRAVEWISANRGFLRQRGRLETAFKNWKDSGEHVDYLLAPGLSLTEAENLRAQFHAFLTAEEIEYISLSRLESDKKQKAIIDALTQEKQRALQTLSQSDFLQSVSLVQQDKKPGALAHLARALRSNPQNHSALNQLYTLLVSQHCWTLPDAPVFSHQDHVKTAHLSKDGNFIVTASADQTARIWNARTGELIGQPLRHEANVYSASFSPDGTMVVTASADQTACLWNARTGELIGTPLQHDNHVFSASFSPDGTRLITASEDKKAWIWEVKTGSVLGRPLEHEKMILSANFSPDGTQVLTASYDRTARLWKALTGEPQGEALLHDVGVDFASFSPDGNRVVTGCIDFTVTIWDVRTGQKIGRPLEHESNINGVNFSPDGKYLITASDDHTARIWEAETGCPAGPVLRHENEVKFAAFSPDGLYVVTASWDKTARLWKVSTGKPTGGVMRHKAGIYWAGFSPDGFHVVTASADGTARIWNARAEKEISLPLQHQGRVNSVSFSPNGAFVLTASADHTAQMWDARTGQSIHAPLIHQAEVYSAFFSPDGHAMVTASADKTARIWDTHLGMSIGRKMVHENNVRLAVFSPDGRWIITASYDHTARIWDAKSGQMIGRPLEHKQFVYHACFSPDGSRVVTASEDKTAQIWDAQTGLPIGSALRHEEVVWSAHFSPDGLRVITASGDHTARIWDAKTGEALGDPLCHENEIKSASFSPDGLYIVTASWDKSARIWDARSCHAIGQPLVHESLVNAAGFSWDGKRIVTASGDNTARVWDVPTGQPLGIPLVHEGNVISAGFSPDGAQVVTASSDHTARIWNLLPPCHATAPNWLPDLAEALGGLKLIDSGATIPVPCEKFFQLKEEFRKSAGTDFWSQAVRPFFSR